ncbi:hypothetical protein BJ741DRAFT_644915 [Chytriomyces cf. hyalinus JEL632]|nr:hypothetical protein BJ741DRAFT_644915 [Chytriomyces cf. hyalinus JEL632]
MLSTPRLFAISTESLSRALIECAKGNTDSAKALLNTAIAAMDRVLSDGRSLSPADELNARVAIAEILLSHSSACAATISLAEVHVHKATIISQKLGSPTHQILLLKALQISIMHSQNNLKTCHKLLKEAALVSEASFRPWFFYFISRRVDLLLEDNDVKAAHATLAGACVRTSSNPNDASIETRKFNTQMKIAFLLRRVTICISVRDSAQAEGLISKELDPILSEKIIAPPLSQSMIPVVETHASSPHPHPFSNNPPLETLQAHFLLLKVILQCQSGKKKEAKPTLENLCSIVTAWSSGGNLNEVERIDHVHVLSRRQLVVFVNYAVACLVADFDPSRAVASLKECAQKSRDALCGGTVDELDKTIADLVASQRWYTEMHILAMHQLCQVYLLKSDSKRSKEALDSVVEFIHMLPNRDTELQKHMPVILLNWGFYNQASGQSDAASRCYFGAAALAADDARRSEMLKQSGLRGCLAASMLLADEEVQAVAAFSNGLLLLSSGDVVKIEMAKKVLEEVKKDVKEIFPGQIVGNSNSMGTSSSMADYEHMKAFVSMSNAVNAHMVGETKKTKMYLLETLRASDVILSNQLKTTTLVMLGSLFLETDPKQTEKMVHTAHKLCKKSGNEAMMRVCKQVLEELAKRDRKTAGGSQSQQGLGKFVE